MKVAGIILAAGGSTRLGTPKQRLLYQGVTFLRHAATTALAAGLHPTVVVLGAEAEELRTELDGLPVQVAVNADWRSGMGGSLRVGLATVGPEPDAALVMLCDQPLVDAPALRRLMAVFAAAENPNAMAASEFDGTLGVPAVFGRSHFAALASIDGDQGARALLRQHADRVIAAPLPAAGTDIDTRAQYERLPPSEPAA